MELSDTALRITDKMTLNFMFIGLIHLALPDAAIIHAVRDPADTCLSSFLTHFTNGNEHTYDLAELGRYYRHYQALMAHWHAVLPPGRSPLLSSDWRRSPLLPRHFCEGRQTTECR